MIIIKIKGGLGNQLFQYAFARSLSYNLDKELFLDVSYFSHLEKRKHVIFGLDSFNIKGIIGYYPYSDKTVVGLNYNTTQKLTEYKEGIDKNYPKNVFEYKTIKNIDNIKFPAFFDGFFQQQLLNDENSFITENFFIDNSELIHNDFKYLVELSDEYNLLIKDMEKYDSIAIHIRHGDYEKLPELGLCSKEYYQKAIDYMGSKLNNPKFFIFSEDHEWADNNLIFEYPMEHVYFSEKNNIKNRGYSELLKVMSLCKNFIIANSTFSWWASFLSENRNKIIITPKPWFQDRSYVEVDTIDRIDTIKIKNDYEAIFNNSSNILFDFNLKNMRFENLDVNCTDNYIILNDLNENSKILLNNINKKNPQNEIILKISMKSYSMNCLKFNYECYNKQKLVENSRLLYYYNKDKFTQYLIFPSNIKLDKITIMPFILEQNGKNTLEIEDISIKEVNYNIFKEKVDKRQESKKRLNNNPYKFLNRLKKIFNKK